MTDENTFQKMLDANPADHLTRLVLADWLQDHDDERAEGYRALAVNGKHPCKTPLGCPYWYRNDNSTDEWHLPYDWFAHLDVVGSDNWNAPTWSVRRDATRRELEDAAAIAFLKLPDERRAGLLAGQISQTVA